MQHVLYITGSSTGNLSAPMGEEKGGGQKVGIKAFLLKKEDLLWYSSPNHPPGKEILLQRNYTTTPPPLLKSETLPTILTLMKETLVQYYPTHPLYSPGQLERETLLQYLFSVIYRAD
jgi:hypothetical protein